MIRRDKETYMTAAMVAAGTDKSQARDGSTIAVGRMAPMWRITLTRAAGDAGETITRRVGAVDSEADA